MPLQLKRVYDEPDPADGERILVDRLWPRGLNKQAAALDLWLKDVAPSAELRRWFHHGAERWEEFCIRYRGELGDNPHIAELRKKIAAGPVTLLYAARDRERNHALVLAEFLAADRQVPKSAVSASKLGE